MNKVEAEVEAGGDGEHSFDEGSLVQGSGYANGQVSAELRADSTSRFDRACGHLTEPTITDSCSSG